jgi:hypothetical protein
MDKMSFAMLGAIICTLFVAGMGNAGDSNQWVWYGTTEMGDSYYDKGSVTKVSSDVITLWNRDKYSKAGKEEIIQRRKSYGLSVDGYEKLDHVTDLVELDCANRTMKDMKFVEYDDNDKALYVFEYPDPRTKQVLPGTTTETLLKAVCP